MNKGKKIISIVLIIALIIVVGYFIVKYILGSNDKKNFISSAQELYKSALREKNSETKYYDSKSNKLQNSDLNYHIEFNSEGNIIYFLAYDNEHVIEIEEMNVSEKDFEADKNYGDLSNENYASAVDYKHESLNNKYQNTTSDYNNAVINSSDNQTEMPEIEPEPEPEPLPDPTPTTPDTNDKIPAEETKYKVMFNANGGSGGQTQAVEVKYNEIMPSISKSVPSRSGYTFMGWYDNSDYTKGKVYYNEKCEATKYYDKKTNITLYAGWKKNTTVVTPTVPTPTVPTPTTPVNNKITYTVKSESNCKQANDRGHTEGYLNGSYEYTIHMGRVPNGCYSVEITKVTIDDNDNAKVYVKNHYPSVTSTCTQAIAYPCATVTFSRKPNTIETIEENGNVETPVYNNTETLTYSIDKTTNCTSSTLPKKLGLSTQTSADGYKVILGLGQKNHGGYSIKIDSVNIDKNNNVIINATSTSPEPGSMTTQAINYPCAVVTFNNTPTSVKAYIDGVDANNISDYSAGNYK